MADANPVSGESQEERDFYLQDTGARELIDDRIHAGVKVLQTVKACSWREAKEAMFGP